jgi:hypothetical protein
LEKKKVKLVVVEFIDYAMVWWERLVVKKEGIEKDQLAHGRS